MQWLIGLASYGATCAVIGGVLGELLRGRLGGGIVWGLVLGPIGWLVVLLLPDLRRTPQLPAAAGAPLRSAIEPEFCLKCGVDGVANQEFGRTIYDCPKCGQRLGTVRMR